MREETRRGAIAEDCLLIFFGNVLNMLCFIEMPTSMQIDTMKIYAVHSLKRFRYLAAVKANISPLTKEAFKLCAAHR